MRAATGLPTDRHWATVPTEQLPQVLDTLKQRFWGSLEDSGRLYLWRRSERTYYGEDEAGGWKESAAVQYGGEQGELALIRMNQYRSIIQAILSMATSERPAFFAKAVNSSTQSLIEAPIATGLIEFYYNDKRIDDLVQTTAERALILGEGFHHNRWNILAGKAIGQDPKTGAIVHEGDVCPESVSPLSVIRDLKEPADNLKWCIVATWVNLWDLVAAYPQEAERLQSQRGSAWWPDTVWSDEYQRGKLGNEEDPDRVVVWTLYHLPSDAVPQGRYSLICGEVVLSDEAMKLDEIPVYACVPSKHIDKNEGNSALWDLLAPQEAYDAAWSSLLTVHDSYTIGNLYVPKGSGITPAQIASGMRLIEYNYQQGAPNGGMPMPVNYMTLPTAAYEFPDAIKAEMQTISGVNSVARGEVDDNVKSGTMAALIQSLAVKFNSGVQRSVVHLHERIAGGLLKMLKAHSDTPKVAEVMGTGAAEYLRTVQSSDVEDVKRVIVETANPLTQQLAGRMELAEKMAQLFPGKMTMEQFVQVVETGQTAPLYKRAKAVVDVIAQENDMLRAGQLPPVAYVEQPQPPPPTMPGMPPLPPMGIQQPTPRTCHPNEDHAIHVQEHSVILTPDFKADPMRLKAFDQHMADHYAVWSSMPADMAAFTGQSLPPPPPIGAPPLDAPAKPDAPKGAAPPPKDGPSRPEPEKARPLGGQPQPNMPSMPRPAGGGPPIPA